MAHFLMTVDNGMEMEIWNAAGEPSHSLE